MSKINQNVVYYKDQYFEIVLDGDKRIVGVKKQKTGRLVKENTPQWFKVASIYFNLLDMQQECVLRNK